MAELALEQTLDLDDYLAAFRRRGSMITFIAASVFLLGLITAFVLPPTYQASATILIEEQEIPVELIQSTVTSYAAQRIQVISQRVMTRTNMLEIMDKYGLYKSVRNRKSSEQALADMRNDVSIDMINAEVMDPRTGRPRAATIAFKLGFKGEQPKMVQKVVNELTTLYLNENLRTRTEKAEETTAFLTEESNRLSAEITRLETALAAFKERNANRLPEQRDLNFQALERTERDIATIDTQLGGLDEKRIYLNGQLALLDPYSSSGVMSSGARLEALRTEFIHLSTRYSPGHPDVMSMKREIEALEQETGLGPSTADLQAQLSLLQQELASLEQSYTAEHPDVKSLKRQIATVESELRNPPPMPTTAPASADNPAYVNLQSQLAAANTEARTLRARRAQLVAKLADYEERLLQMPKVEQEYRTITRNMENATRRYQEINAKQMTAEVAQSMEQERKGEKFTLIDPAILPEEPISPNRPAIILLGLVLALGAGVGSAALAESTDSAVRGAKSLMGILNTAPLAVIPYLPSAADIRSKASRKWLIIAAVIGVIAIVLMLLHFLYSPLDVLWFRGIRKLDNIVGS
jgi:uncharacterized protein involved in exopolysaccharide biosynthesis